MYVHMTFHLFPIQHVGKMQWLSRLVGLFYAKMHHLIGFLIKGDLSGRHLCHDAWFLCFFQRLKPLDVLGLHTVGEFKRLSDIRDAEDLKFYYHPGILDSRIKYIKYQEPHKPKIDGRVSMRTFFVCDWDTLLLELQHPIL